ncbi:MAG TPA: HYR domain-containing protein [Candidatus Saccharimonadales bacterium]|nr:HYR domain-containing protein [Candidatus Saccharimonadales bacterium]
MSRSHHTWLVTAAVCLIALASATAASGQATVATNKADYAPGDTVLVTGTGWQPGEVVTLTFRESPSPHPPQVITATADADGRFENRDYIAHAHGDSTQCTIDALGNSSGLTARTTFTDSPNVLTCYVNPQSPNPVPPGGTATFEVDVLAQQGFLPGRTVVFQTDFLPTWPSGVSNNYNPSSLVFSCFFGCGLQSKPMTETFTVSSWTTPGSYTFRVKAFDANNPSDYTYGYGTLSIGYPPGTVAGKVSADCPAPASGAPAVPIKVYTTSYTLVASTSTDSSGNYTVANLTAGQYIVAMVPSSDWAPVGPTNTQVTIVSGQTTQANFQLSDVGPPKLTVPADVNTTTGPASSVCGLVIWDVWLGTATATDNCPGPVTIERTGVPAGNFFPVGTTTLTYTATDGTGHKTVGTQRVTVADDAPPRITAPPAVTVGTDAGSCVATGVQLGIPQVSDNCPGVNYTNDAPAVFAKGTTRVNWTAWDASRNSVTTPQFVTVEDREKPVIVAPAAVVVPTDPGKCSASGVALGTPTTSDNCGVASVTNDAPAVFPKGATTVTWTVTDVSGNTGTAVQLVTVEDREKPAVVAPAAVVVPTDPGKCSASGVSLGAPTASDNCGVASLTNDAPEVFPKGTTTVTWTARDAAGNAATATQRVTVEDHEAPALVAPAEVIVSTDAGKCTASGVSLGTPTAADNCGVESVNNDAPGVFPKGTTTITWTARDAAGNAATATQRVTVEDHEAPALAAPPEVVVPADPGKCSASGVALGTPSASDNCEVASVTHDAPAIFPKGATSVTWTVTDGAGNKATAVQTVTVEDREKPVLAAPAAVVVPTDAGTCMATAVALGTPIASDNCEVASVTSDAPAIFPKGATTVTWTARDAAGNAATATQLVTVQDRERPVIAAPAAVVVATDAGKCSATEVSLGTPAASDNCEIASVTSDAPAIFPKGATTVTWTATDASGNKAAAAQTVTVEDRERPVLTCPTDIYQCTDSGLCTAVVTYAPTAADNCPGVTVNCSPLSGHAFPVGATTVGVTATDAAGNTSSCSFRVVVSNPAPVVTITAPAGGTTFPVGTKINFAGHFTDNPGDTHTAQWTYDGNTRPGTVDEGAGGVTGSYTFNTPGVYFVSLAVTDQCGGSDTASTVGDLDATVVVYDSNDGFVMGGGWFDSPPGAYPPIPALGGKACFGFISKYKKGGSVPKGNTEFYLKSARLRFHSISYDWLVVTGNWAQFKGTGTLNGKGRCELLLTAIDGHLQGGASSEDGQGGRGCRNPDKIRIKITDKSTGSVIYDNQPGSPDQADPTTALGGGCVVIHSPGRGATVAGGGGLATAESDASPPTEYRLHPNGPNPFAQGTTIRFDLPAGGRVKLAVYDVAGRLVKTLLNETQEAGRHEVQWLGESATGTRARGGVYFCRIAVRPGASGQGFHAVQKMILLQ